MYPASWLPQLQVNDDYAAFTSFYTFLKNAGVVPRTQDTVCFCGATLSDEDKNDLTIPNYIPPTSNKD